MAAPAIVGVFGWGTGKAIGGTGKETIGVERTSYRPGMGAKGEGMREWGVGGIPIPSIGSTTKPNALIFKLASIESANVQNSRPAHRYLFPLITWTLGATASSAAKVC